MKNDLTHAVAVDARNTIDKFCELNNIVLESYQIVRSFNAYNEITIKLNPTIDEYGCVQAGEYPKWHIINIVTNTRGFYKKYKANGCKSSNYIGLPLAVVNNLHTYFDKYSIPYGQAFDTINISTDLAALYAMFPKS